MAPRPVMVSRGSRKPQEIEGTCTLLLSSDHEIVRVVKRDSPSAEANPLSRQRKAAEAQVIRDGEAERHES